MLERMRSAAAARSTAFLSMTFQRDDVVLAFDFGMRRIGVAIANGVTWQARPLTTLEAVGDSRWAAITQQIEQWSPSRLVVGVPRHPDGAAHEMTARCEKFARQLEGRFGLPVARVDERYSTVVVSRERDIDAAAAAVILQQWIEATSAHG